MATIKLTKTSIADLIPGAGIDLYWDEEVPGFGVRVSPGGTKAFVVQFREGTATKRRTLGNISLMALEKARNKAKDILAAVRLGEVLPLKKDDGPVFGEVLDRFIAFAEAKKAPRTAHDYKVMIDGHIRPVFGAKRIRRITRAEIEEWHEGMAETPRTGNYRLVVLVAVFSYAVRMKIIGDAEHPARAIPKYAENKRRRYLSLEEIQRFGQALGELEAEKKVSPWAAAALRLLILTGARSGEILTLEWDHVDLERGELNLPTSKTGPKTIKLSGAAVRVLATIPKIEACPWVIAGKHHGEHMTSLQKPWELTIAKARLSAVRIHDLRHSAASVATSEGVGLAVVGSLLGQSQAYTTARYSHIYDSAERKAAEVIADKVAPLLNVVALASHKKSKRAT